MAAAALEAAESESSDPLHQLNDAHQAPAALEGLMPQQQEEDAQQPAVGANVGAIGPAAEQAAQQTLAAQQEQLAAQQEQLAAQQEQLTAHTAALAKLMRKAKRLKTLQRELKAQLGGGAPGQGAA